MTATSSTSPPSCADHTRVKALSSALTDKLAPMPSEGRFVFTDRSHGDLAVTGDSALLATRRDAVAPLPWTWLRQVHGADVVVVRSPGAHAGMAADAAVTSVPGAVVAVATADCAPLVLLADGAVGVVHAGWRGLLAGVVGRAVEALADLGPVRRAVLGPTIAAHHYAFGADDLDSMVQRFGPEVCSTTWDGTPALDVPATVAAALAEYQVPLAVVGVCTACSPNHWSHRARGERGRQVAVAWVPPSDASHG